MTGTTGLLLWQYIASVPISTWAAIVAIAASLKFAFKGMLKL